MYINLFLALAALASLTSSAAKPVVGGTPAAPPPAMNSDPAVFVEMSGLTVIQAAENEEGAYGGQGPFSFFGQSSSKYEKTFTLGEIQHSTVLNEFVHTYETVAGTKTESVAMCTLTAAGKPTERYVVSMDVGLSGDGYAKPTKTNGIEVHCTKT